MAADKPPAYPDPAIAPLADACVTEWRFPDNSWLPIRKPAPLADACVTEWRRNFPPFQPLALFQRHSLMLVLLNGGTPSVAAHRWKQKAPLADACVTEWRWQALCEAGTLWLKRHSLMLVLLNGGTTPRIFLSSARRHSLMLVLLNGGGQSTRTF